MVYPSKLTVEQILDAAQALLEDSGAAALSMRTLAERLGVQASSLYRHHASRELLLRALGDRATTQLEQAIRAASLGHSPRAALEAMAQAYLAYARSQPQLYALLLTPAAPGTDLQGTPGKALWNTLLRLIGALSGEADDTDHAVAFWTFLHGFAVLERSGLFGPGGPRGGLEAGLGALLDRMEAQVRTRR
jgi:AcrR family transcriptional regulator